LDQPGDAILQLSNPGCDCADITRARATCLHGPLLQLRSRLAGFLGHVISHLQLKCIIFWPLISLLLALLVQIAA